LETIDTKRHIFYLLKVALIALYGLSIASCTAVKHLPEEDSALVKNKFAVLTDDPRVDIGQIKTDIKGLIKQKPVKKLWLNPRTWRTPLTTYDERETKESAEAIQQYLRNRKGFYKADVAYKEELIGRRMTTTYIVDLGDRYYIGSVEVVCPDTSLRQLILEHNTDRRINPGDPLDAKIFDEEEVRLIDLAKNNGYAEFNPNYIIFRGDSSTSVPVTIQIFTPLDKKKHQKYTLGKVNVYTEHIASANPTFTKVDTVGNTVYYGKSKGFIVKPESLHKIISLRSGEVFSRSNQFLTNRTLSRLTPYRFVTLNPTQDSEVDSLYNFDIFLTPQRSKWAFDMGANVFYSLLNQSPSVSARDLFGFAGNIGWTNRNFANRAITHSFGLEGSFEFEIPTFNANTVSIQANNSFRIPRIVDIFNLSSLLNNVGLLTDRSYKNLNLYGETDVDFSVGVTDIINAYRINTINASWSYKFQPDERNRYVWRQIGLNILDTSIDDVFQSTILDSNPLLERSFDDYLLTGVLMRELSLFRQTKESARGGSVALLGNLEFSGLEVLALNSIFSPNADWRVANLDFASFIRFDTDLRYYKKVKERSSLALRFNVGVAFALGGEEEVIPFVKTFFVGGPNSLRGWQIRELGPGSFSDKILNPVAGEPFFQTGDFKLELNAEYRFDLFWFWEGAIFVDAGNSWTLRTDPDRPGSKLSSRFLDEIAISTGWGLRADFDYFLLRFDVGYKVRSPFEIPDTGSHIIWDQNSFLGNINFAINYPF